MRRNSSSERALIAFPLPSPQRDTAAAQCSVVPQGASHPLPPAAWGCDGGSWPQCSLPHGSPGTPECMLPTMLAPLPSPERPPQSLWVLHPSSNTPEIPQGIESCLLCFGGATVSCQSQHTLSWVASTGSAWWPQPCDGDKTHCNLDQRH